MTHADSGRRRGALSALGGIAGSLFLMLGIISCAPALIVGGGTTTAVVGAQERSAGAALDDAGISAKVQARLLSKAPKLFVNTGVEVNEGRVLLTGVVKSDEDKTEAGRLVWETSGVKEVLNELQVVSEQSFFSGIKHLAIDTRITTELLNSMVQDKDVVSINYTVETVNGIVYLIGIARSDSELAKVTDYARNINGVKKVVSHVRVGVGGGS